MTMIEITISKIAGRDFINFGQACSIPVDRIKQFDFMAPNGGASGHSVRVITDDPDEEIYFAFNNCDAVREFLENAIVEDWE